MRLSLLLPLIAALLTLIPLASCSEKTDISQALILDDAHLLSEQQIAAITRHHDRLLQAHDIDYRVVTTKTGSDIEKASHQAFIALSAGARSKSGHGLLLFIDPVRKQSRLEASAAIKGIYTDSFISYIEHSQMPFFFNSGQVASGVIATTEAILVQAEKASRAAADSPAVRKPRWDMTVRSYEDAGTVVEKVGPNSPAEMLGFRSGDRILQWENIKTPHHTEIEERMEKLQPDQDFVVLLMREGKAMIINGVAPPVPAEP